ncbi:hypothetical protein M9Y10_018665 [Tritrichomonas musculus]|uniref:Beta-lactamase n=1 Tax=Tritrichomonas musculus TaxID=1915356 RepID=A0ABR2HMB5_9EUKA
MYENGNGVKKNVDKALSYYQKAAEKGYSDSYAAMGLIYFNGNREKAFGCFKKAADMGSPSGCYLTGLCYQDGTGVTKDRSKALEHFRKADKLGYDGAKEKLKSLIT